MTSHIIGVSGNMGAGKTKLAIELASNLHGTLLGWDDFDEISNGPKDYIDWHKRGQNYSEWDYRSLSEVLRSLKSDKSAIHPVLKIDLYPTEYIIFDAPLGRFHKQTGIYIDTWVHIDVPLEASR